MLVDVRFVCSPVSIVSMSDWGTQRAGFFWLIASPFCAQQTTEDFENWWKWWRRNCQWHKVTNRKGLQKQQKQCANEFEFVSRNMGLDWLVPIEPTISNRSARPYESCKILRAGPAEMPFQNWYTANTNHFPPTDSVRWKFKKQQGSVINPVPHNLVRRIRFWRIKISG